MKFFLWLFFIGLTACNDGAITTQTNVNNSSTSNSKTTSSSNNITNNSKGSTPKNTNNTTSGNSTTTTQTTNSNVDLILNDLKAFPTAMGGGSKITGGRGGTVHWITTTQPSGTGSFQEALKNGEGNKTIMFAVGGSFPHNYHLASDLQNITIAGQTAHELGGVYIDNDGNDEHFFYLNTINSIWRYISTRGNRIPPDSNGDPVLYTHQGDTIFDHITDFGGNSSSGPMSGVNITVQYCLGTEANSSQTQDTGFQSYQPGYDGPSGYFDYIYNAMLLKSHRSPSVSGNSRIKYRIIENYIYGWNSRHVNVYGTPSVDIYNNVYQESNTGQWSPHDMGNTYAVEHQSAAGDGHGSIFLKNNWHRKSDFSDLFTIDNSNVQFHKPDGGDPYSVPDPRTDPMDPPRFYKEHNTPEAVKKHVLENAGAGVRYSKNKIETVTNFEKRYKEWARNSNEDGTRESRSSYNTIEEQSRNLTDFERLHGFPENWAVKHGLGTSDNVHNRVEKDWKDLNGLFSVTNNAGYTNLEIYLAELAGDFHMLSQTK